VTPQKNNVVKILIGLLVLLSVTLRFMSLPYSNRDMIIHNLRWYETLNQQGIDKALATNFANYTPPYTYFIALATLTHNFIPPLTAIKIIPICFDLLGAFFIYKIVKLKYQQGNLSHLAAAIYFAAPTILLNSAYWGQADSIYTSALLICIYFLVTERPFIAMLAFGAAFSFKAQAVFLIPFLGIMLFRKKIHWLYFGLIPLVYLLAIAPVVILGRPLIDALLIYVKQSGSYPVLSMNAPNIYILFPNEWYSFIMPLGLVVAVLLILRWVYVTLQAATTLDHKYLILIALISTTLIPFLLPKMHDRYFYPSDVLSIALAFYWPSLWFVPILYQLGSLGATSIFLVKADPAFIVIGFLFNTVALAVLLRKQSEVENRAATNKTVSMALSWLASILIPIIFFGFGLNMLVTPSFVRVQYALSPAARSNLTKSERFHWASQSVDYLTNDRKTKFLENLKFENGALVFENREITLLDNAKKMTQAALALRNISLAFCFILGLLAWAGNWLPKLSQGIYRGGWLAMGLAVTLGLASIIGRANLNAYFQGADTILQLFPNSFWRDSLLFMLIILGGSGFLLTKIITVLQGRMQYNPAA